MTPEQITELQNQLGVALASLDWQTERANAAVNRFQEVRAERDALQARVDGALKAWGIGYDIRRVIKILTGEDK